MMSSVSVYEIKVVTPKTYVIPGTEAASRDLDVELMAHLKKAATEWLAKEGWRTEVPRDEIKFNNESGEMEVTTNWNDWNNYAYAKIKQIL